MENPLAVCLVQDWGGRSRGAHGQGAAKGTTGTDGGGKWGLCCGDLVVDRAALHVCEGRHAGFLFNEFFNL